MRAQLPVMMMRMKYVAWHLGRYGKQVAYFEEHPRAGRERLWEAAQQAMEKVHGHGIAHGVRMVVGNRSWALKMGRPPESTVPAWKEKLLARDIIRCLSPRFFLCRELDVKPAAAHGASEERKGLQLDRSGQRQQVDSR